MCRALLQKGPLFVTLSHLRVICCRFAVESNRRAKVAANLQWKAAAMVMMTPTGMGPSAHARVQSLLSLIVLYGEWALSSGQISS